MYELQSITHPSSSPPKSFQQVTMIMDNQSAQGWIKGAKLFKARKIDLAHDLICQAQRMGECFTEYMPTGKLPADMLKKPLTAQKSSELCRAINIEIELKRAKVRKRNYKEEKKKLQKQRKSRKSISIWLPLVERLMIWRLAKWAIDAFQNRHGHQI